MSESPLQGLLRILNLALFPLLLFVTATVLYSLYPQLINDTFVRLPWLTAVCLTLAGVMSWQFGRSRLVWLSILFVFITQPNIQSWLDLHIITFSLHSYVLLILTWLMLSKDAGFSPRNLGVSVLIIILLGLLSAYLLPLAESVPQIEHYVISPSTQWLLALWPTLSQWFSPIELLLVLISGVVSLVMLAKRSNASQVILVLSWCSYMMLMVNANVTLNDYVGCLLAIIILYAVVRDSFAMAFKDELTGVPSRRALMQKVETLGRKYTLVMSDIDHFKKFNDTYGHDVGDEVLKLVASKLSKITGGGHAFRFGGEEFVILFPNRSPEDVLPHVEAIRSLIADYDVAIRTKPRPTKKPESSARKVTKNKIVKVTSSFGVAQRSKQHSDFQSVMKQADIALYKAKKSGRNCVKVAKQ